MQSSPAMVRSSLNPPTKTGSRESEFRRRSRESEFPPTKIGIGNWSSAEEVGNRSSAEEGIGVPSYQDRHRESEFPPTKRSRESEFRRRSRESEFPPTVCF